ncbi:MAG: hypothetical protein GKS00_28515 [Alphaproteobacteria bacterium]|nr:hypothetical protein [Alphaproteobacteria bacterium]
MRIKQRKDSEKHAAGVREALDEILQSNADGTPVCAPDCPKAGAHCSRLCADIPQMLSSDPEKHPLEGGIAPLVYELKRLEAFIPCWSCEGHNGPDGTLWKLPRVWFYCDSVVQLRVLADAITALHIERKLNVPWRIALTFSDDDNADTTFSLEPVLEQERPTLASLQHDVDTIAAHLRSGVFVQARQLIRRTE